MFFRFRCIIYLKINVFWTSSAEMRDFRKKIFKRKLMKVQVIKERCPQNHKCPAVQVCPTDALTQKTIEAPAVNMEKCIGCNKCVGNCPGGAFILSEEN